MTPKRVSVVVGTRPEAIKMAPVVRALKERPEVATRLVCTGQHDSLLSDVLPALGLVPDVNLRIMQPDQSLSGLGGACLSAMTEEFESSRPDLVLVQGDTASAFFSGLAAFFLRVPVGHVEAGLRSGDMTKPFPEEGFRRLIDGFAALHFCPTETSRTNLSHEGITGDDVHVTGNTVVDALLEVVRQEVPAENLVLAGLLDSGTPFVLLTVHRRESFGHAIEGVFRAVQRLVSANPGIEVLFPVHPNPSVIGPARKILGANSRVHLVDPLRYPDLVLAMKEAALVMTDSGGIQEEAPTFGTPVLVLREVTDRPEGIRAGVVELVGTDAEVIVSRASRVLAQSSPSDRGELKDNPHGMGDAGRKIVSIVLDFLSRGSLA